MWVGAARIGSVARGTVSTPFVARSDEVEALLAALARAGEGEPSAMLVAGDAGVGKSALVRHVTERAGAGGARVVVVRTDRDENVAVHREIEAAVAASWDRARRPD